MIVNALAQFWRTGRRAQELRDQHDVDPVELLAAEAEHHETVRQLRELHLEVPAVFDSVAA